MAEPPIRWKIKTLKEIRASPEGSAFLTKGGEKEYEWFLDMKRDGLVSGDFQKRFSGSEVRNQIQEAMKQNSVIPIISPEGGITGFFNLHVPEKGKKFIEDYEAKTTIRGFWKTYHIWILRWILGIGAIIIAAILIHEYGLK